MLYRALDDFVVLIHAAFVVFVLLGGLLTLRFRRAPWLHLPAAGWGAAVELFGWFCPLTPLENWLRRAGDSAGYSGGFIEYYLMPIIYPVELTREVQLFAGGLVVVLNLAIYRAVWHQRRTREVHT
jgi:hypothetical protein